MRFTGICAIALFATSISAAPITYTFTATGSGTIGSNSFTDVLVTITGIGDTSDIFAAPDPPFPANDFIIDPAEFTITIPGVGTATFPGTSSSFGGNGYFFDNQTNQVAGFGIESDRGDVDGAFTVTYDLSTSIGPLPDEGMSFNGESTSLGSLTFATTTDGDFTAVLGPTVAPEPSSILLLLGGLGWIILRRSRL